MFMILTLIVLVAPLNIISGLIMLVKDKGSDIAILRTMGATRGAVMRIFLMTGPAIGVVGTLAGVARRHRGLPPMSSRSGQFFSWLSGTRCSIPRSISSAAAARRHGMDPREVVTVIVDGAGLSFLATLYPGLARRRLDPVEALSYE
jgi:lipoprotein-releasing system permease protein